LALLLPQKKRAQRALSRLKCSFRALKVLGYFFPKQPATDIATAALDQPGDEVGAYGRTRLDWQR
jgi:hypothetical protein